VAGRTDLSSPKLALLRQNRPAKALGRGSTWGGRARGRRGTATPHFCPGLRGSWAATELARTQHVTSCLLCGARAFYDPRPSRSSRTSAGGTRITKPCNCEVSRDARFELFVAFGSLPFDARWSCSRARRGGVTAHGVRRVDPPARRPRRVVCVTTSSRDTMRLTSNRSRALREIDRRVC
jgi:hypothetical protein